MDETIEQYIARGGVIKRYRSRADEIAARIKPRSKYVQYDVLREITARKNKKRQLKINARKKTIVKAGDPPEGSSQPAQISAGLTAKKNGAVGRRP